jgi:transketolase
MNGRQIAPPRPVADQAEVERLEEVARRIRVAIIETVYHAKVGHIGGPLSAADLLAALYFHALRIRPEEPDWPDRDRFILSKGHSSLVQYAALALRGYFPVAELATFDSLGSRLQGHPDMLKLPGIDMSTGSLGMGISAGMGIALGGQLTGRDFRIYVMLGDGECQEGSVWEAAFCAARYKLGNLVAVVDHNKLQQYGWPGEARDHTTPPQGPGELVARWTAFGWRVIECEGHDMRSILGALADAAIPGSRPVVIIAHTVKGKGVSFMEGQYSWHTRVIEPEQYAAAMAELGESRQPAEGAGR